MSATTYTSDPASKVASIVFHDGDHDGYGKALEHRCSGRGDWESTVFAWGYVFGVAYAIARGEDPYQPHELAAARAYEVADRVHREFTGGRVTREAVTA